MNNEILDITLRSLAISSSATVLALTWSIPASIRIAAMKSKWRDPIIGIFNTLIGFPTVLVGLLLYLLFSRAGPLGLLNMLYTPQAIVIGQAILITPLLISLMYEVFTKAIGDYWELAMSLGASKSQAYKLVMREVIGDIVVISLIGFARAIGELGVALLVGGNIKGITRVLTTAIALEVEKGEFEEAIILGAILLMTILIIVVTARVVKRRFQ